MHITGIICEYNPLHLGHKKQMDIIRKQHFDDSGIVCLMSGNFVQRGHPAVFDKITRAKAAMACGADLVLELPVTAALSSAEGFAFGGVEILSRLCHSLCFGAETAEPGIIMQTAEALLRPDFSAALRLYLDQGHSFPAARQSALADMGLDSRLLETPNNILAVEYCKAILSQNSPLTPMPIRRDGSYHDRAPDPSNPSATSLRNQMSTGGNWLSFVPPDAQPVVAGAVEHRLSYGEKAMLYRLRAMSEAEFQRLPYGSEGLWRKFMHACRKESSLEEILTATKSKRYTRTRLDRMAMCAFLGLTAEDLSSPAPYCRILALNDKGRAILKQHNREGYFINIGTDTGHPYQLLERQVTALYGLFAALPEMPNAEERYRVYYQKGE